MPYTFEEHVADLQAHVARVQANAKLLAERLVAKGNEELARVLLANAHVHDASKWHGIEWEYMHMGPDVDPVMLRKAITQHQKTNGHHPEFWGGIAKMPVVFLGEMVCDWLARSQELATDFNNWLDREVPKRFDVEHAQEQMAAIRWMVGLLLPQKFAKV